MIDVNLPMRKAYFARLTGIIYNSIPVPVYYSYLPDDIDPDFYIVFGGISNNSIGTFTTQDTATSMQVTVFTKAHKNNDGNAADVIGGEVLQRIFATQAFNIDLPAGTPLQITGTTLESDTTRDWSLQTSLIYIDRTLQFRHTIFQK